MAKRKSDSVAIYRITHKSSGRAYIGQTLYPNERWCGHVYYALSQPSKTYLANAIRRYGPDAFIYEVLSQYPKHLANVAEIAYIELFRSNERTFGFNMSA